MPKKVKNVAASVRARLTEKAKQTGGNVENLMVRYASERFLYRLSLSEHKDKFLLKGAALFSLWFNEPHRPTRDLDFLGFGSSGISALEAIIREVCAVDANDGLQFVGDSVAGERIREEEAYQGVRVEFRAMLGNARIPLRVDVGFGDAVTPKAEEVEFPTILDLPAPKIGVYPKETVVAEKFEAMVRFGMLNSRMKDFWDLRVMVSEFDFEGTVLQRALEATFKNRRTTFPESTPVALTSAFAQSDQVLRLWSGFISRNDLTRFTDLAEVITNLNKFFMPIIGAVNGNTVFGKRWAPNAGWR